MKFYNFYKYHAKWFQKTWCYKQRIKHHDKRIIKKESKYRGVTQKNRSISNYLCTFHANTLKTI